MKNFEVDKKVKYFLLFMVIFPIIGLFGRVFWKAVTERVRKEEAATSGVKYHTKKDITENDIRKEQGQNKRGAY